MGKLPIVLFLSLGLSARLLYRFPMGWATASSNYDERVVYKKAALGSCSIEKL
jgi:hypothetical protein